MAARYFEKPAHAALYALFRPVAPSPLISSILNFLKVKVEGPFQSAVDVGCGSGQSTDALAKHFLNVTGFDISEAQINEASRRTSKTNITFKVSSAESFPLKDESVQLVTAGQASHWFDLPRFYKEVDRVLVPNGVLAMYGYNFPHPLYKDKEKELFKLTNTIYEKDTKGLWGKERLLVDNKYTDKVFTIPYPECRREDDFWYEKKGSVRDLAGYISSWSGFQKYKAVNGEEAGDKLLSDFVKNVMTTTGSRLTPEETELVLRFPFFLLLGRKPSHSSSHFSHS